MSSREMSTMLRFQIQNQYPHLIEEGTGKLTHKAKNMINLMKPFFEVMMDQNVWEIVLPSNKGGGDWYLKLIPIDVRSSSMLQVYHPNKII